MEKWGKKLPLSQPANPKLPVKTKLFFLFADNVGDDDGDDNLFLTGGIIVTDDYTDDCIITASGPHQKIVPCAGPAGPWSSPSQGASSSVEVMSNWPAVKKKVDLREVHLLRATQWECVGNHEVGNLHGWSNILAPRRQTPESSMRAQRD